MTASVEIAVDVNSDNVGNEKHMIGPNQHSFHFISFFVHLLLFYH